MGTTLGVNYSNPRAPQPTDVGGGDPVGAAARGFELGSGIADTIQTKRLEKARIKYIMNLAESDSVDKATFARGIGLGFTGDQIMRTGQFDGDYENTKRYLTEQKMLAPGIAHVGRQLAALAPDQRREALDGMIARFMDSGMAPLGAALVENFGNTDLSDEALEKNASDMLWLGNAEAALDAINEERERADVNRRHRENIESREKIAQENREARAAERAAEDGGIFPGDDDVLPDDEFPDESKIPASGSPDALFGGGDGKTSGKTPAGTGKALATRYETGRKAQGQGGNLAPVEKPAKQPAKNARLEKYQARARELRREMADRDTTPERREEIKAELTRIRAAMGM